LSGSPFGIAPRILGGAAVFLMGLMAVGTLLPAGWSATATAIVDAPPAEIYQWIDAPEGWAAWTFWPDSGLVRSGPEHGRGAEVAWDDAELGSGRFRIEEAIAGERIEYTVRVGGGAMRTDGTLTLSSEGSATRVGWTERGDLGRNPLMGYWAFFMERAQTTQLERNLERLDSVVTGRGRTR